MLFSTKVMFLEGVFLELLGTTKFLSYVNLHPYQIIRSIFYNKFNDSILTVSVDHSDDFTSLKCRTTSIKHVQRLCFPANPFTVLSNRTELKKDMIFFVRKVSPGLDLLSLMM